MSTSADLRRQVKIRAEYCSEYCLLPETSQTQAHHIDHIRAQKHGGDSVAENLALACPACNLAKASNLGSFDPETDNFEFFFNPRTQVWREHFQLQNAEITAAMAIGRATIRIFRFNTVNKLLERAELLRFGLYTISTNNP